MGTGIAVRTAGGGKQLPGGARFLLLLPLQVTGKQVKGIDLVGVSLGGRLKIEALPVQRFYGRQLGLCCTPPRGKAGVIAY